MKEALSTQRAYLSGWGHVRDRMRHEIKFFISLEFHLLASAVNTIHAISPPNFAGIKTTLNTITKFLFHRLSHIKHLRSVLGLCKKTASPL